MYAPLSGAGALAQTSEVGNVFMRGFFAAEYKPTDNSLLVMKVKRKVVYYLTSRPPEC